jgi:hypothetical protein
MQGLLGQRLLIIRKTDSARFDAIKQADEMKKCVQVFLLVGQMLLYSKQINITLLRSVILKLFSIFSE